MQQISQGEISARTAAAPAAARRTNPLETISTSRMKTRLRPDVYAAHEPRYSARMTNVARESAADPATPAKASTPAAQTATATGNLPEAMGRRRLVG